MPYIGQNKQEVEDFTPNDRYQMHVLNIAKSSKISNEKCKGGARGGMHAKFEGEVGGEHKNEWSGAFGVQNPKWSHPSLVSVWGVQMIREVVEEVHQEGQIWWLWW